MMAGRRTADSFLLAFSIYTVCLVSVQAAQHRYDGDKVLHVWVARGEEWDTVTSILYDIIPMEEVDIWREPWVTVPCADILVPREYYATFTGELDSRNITYTIMIEDVQQLIDVENATNNHRKRRRRRSAMDDIVGTFASLDQIYTWLDYLNSTFPDRVHLFNIGQTHGQRDIIVLKIGDRTVRRPAIWMDSALHAREWVAPATTIYIIHQLLSMYDSDDEIRYFLDTLDWYFLVIANPDGYEYSKTTYRLWRKNTRPITTHCKGVDLNRNWNFMWGGSASEVEVQSMGRFILDNSDVIIAYVSLHSFTQNWLTRWSYTNDESPEDNAWLMNISTRAVAAIEAVHGKDYGVGTAGTLLYLYSGGSADWARGVAGIPYSFLLELRDQGQRGFLLLPEEIVPTAEEAWAGVKVVAWETIRYSQTFTTTTSTTTAAETSASRSTTTHSSSTSHALEPSATTNSVPTSGDVGSMGATSSNQDALNNGETSVDIPNVESDSYNSGAVPIRKYLMYPVIFLLLECFYLIS